MRRIYSHETPASKPLWYRCVSLHAWEQFPHKDCTGVHPVDLFNCGDQSAQQYVCPACSEDLEQLGFHLSQQPMAAFWICNCKSLLRFSLKKWEMSQLICWTISPSSCVVFPFLSSCSGCTEGLRTSTLLLSDTSVIPQTGDLLALVSRPAITVDCHLSNVIHKTTFQARETA